MIVDLESQSDTK